MTFSNNLLVIIFQFVFLILPFLGRALNQTGFISIDCGLSDVTSYTDESSDLTYVSEANFTEAGEIREISESNRNLTDEKQLWNLRSFPEGVRNCYTLKPFGVKGDKYLIRARFFYGNYDGENQPPSFDLYLGVDPWDTVDTSVSNSKNKEIIHVPSSDHIHVCLVNTGAGTPFMSVLELRPLQNDTYKSEPGSSLLLLGRFDFSGSQQPMRYKDDVYDRFWSSLDWGPLINTSLTIENSIHKNIYGVPLTVMNTALTRNKTSSGHLAIIWNNLDKDSEYYLYLHFAELEQLRSNRSREFNIYINGERWFGPFSPVYMRGNTIYSSVNTDGQGNLTISLNKTDSSMLPPILNAFELYRAANFPQLETNKADVEAMSSIESVYELKRNWQGDPCSPEDYVWDGLVCNYNSSDRPTIVSLNLSSSGLNGKIDPSIANLKSLQYLDLSSNNLSGTVPEFLSELTFLKGLNLKGNNLDGPIPSSLVARLNDGLSLSADDNVMGNQTPPPSTNEMSPPSALPPSPNASPPSSYATYFPLFSSLYVLMLFFIM